MPGGISFLYFLCVYQQSVELPLQYWLEWVGAQFYLFKGIDLFWDWNIIEIKWSFEKREKTVENANQGCEINSITYLEKCRWEVFGKWFVHKEMSALEIIILSILKFKIKLHKMLSAKFRNLNFW